jgi:hypothetical protein
MNNLRVAAFLWIAIFGVLQVPSNKDSAKNHSAVTSQTSAPADTQQKSTGAADQRVPVPSQRIDSPSAAAKTEQSRDDVEIQRQLAKYTKNLVWVGIAQAVVLAGTLVVIWRQSKLMKTHADHLKSLADAAESNTIAAGGQLKAMQDQIGQMESSGKQTDKIIEATQKSADAALLNAQAVMNAQRAWILVEAKRWDNPKGFYFEAVNKGDTPAEILSAYVEHEFVQGVPDDLRIPPHYHHPVLIPVRGDNFLVRDEEWALVPPADPESWIDHHGKREAVMNASEFLCFYGEVNYRDTLRSADDKAGIHYTRWCFVYDVFLKIMVASGPQQYRAKS